MTAAASVFFECLPDAERVELRAAAHRRRFEKGTTIFHEGDPGDTLHVIDRGHVTIRQTTRLGDVVTLAVLGPGECFGEQTFLAPGARRTASAICLDAVQTLMVSSDDFESLRRRLPAVDRFLVEVLASQVRRLSHQVVEALHVDADTRILRRVVALADVFDSTTLPVTQDDLASMAGTTRPTVNRALKAAVESGLVELGRGRITILDLDGLAARAER